MNHIPANITLQDLQKHIWDMNVSRGFSDEDASKTLILLMEELGELAKAMRKSIGMKFSNTTSMTDIREELADVQIVLLGLATRLDVDMAEAVEAKEAKNRTRTWE